MSRRKIVFVWGAIGGNLLLVALLFVAVTGVFDYLLQPLRDQLLEPGPPTTSAHSPIRSNGVVGIVEVSKSRVKVGEPVRVTFTLKNTRDTTQVFQTRQYLVLDIKASALVGREPRVFWRWSEGRELTPDMRRLELGPGESKTIEGVWVPDEAANDKLVNAKGILTSEREDLSPDPRPGGGETTVWVEVGNPRWQK